MNKIVKELIEFSVLRIVFEIGGLSGNLNLIGKVFQKQLLFFRLEYAAFKYAIKTISFFYQLSQIYFFPGSQVTESISNSLIFKSLLSFRKWLNPGGKQCFELPISVFQISGPYSKS
jgi:hypothetical protein